MKIYTKGTLDDARRFAYDWARRANKTLLQPSKKKWHQIHSLEADTFVYFVTEKMENPDCDRCIIIFHGHEAEGRYIKLKPTDDGEITIDDFIKHWRTVADKKDPVIHKMMKQYTPKEIIGSYLYIDYKERNLV